ncbi:hypothetical protein GCM10010510_41970 [Streptomyces anandii JCM 4720]|nr:hypothetical protein GCM10010510_41970 [Streptomyces anandii JCM 4720]
MNRRLTAASLSPHLRPAGASPSSRMALPSLYNPALRRLVSPHDRPVHLAPTDPTDERERPMRRTVLSALALACTAVLASTVPAFADGGSPTTAPRKTPTAAPAEPGKTAPTPVPTEQAPSAEPTVPGTKPTAPRPVPTTAPTRAPSRGQVAVVPKGAPDTGVAVKTSQSGPDAAVIGGSAAGAALLAGGAAVFVVRRRRATGA